MNTNDNNQAVDFNHIHTFDEVKDTLHKRTPEFDFYLWRCPYGKRELVFEGFAKCKGGVKYFVFRYRKLSLRTAKSHVLKYGAFSPRPYQLAQACDGSITTCALALFVRFCRDCGHDADALLRAAYPDGRKIDWDKTIVSGDWEGVAYPAQWDEKAKAGLLESLHAVNYHSLATEVSDLINTPKPNHSTWTLDENDENLTAPDGKRFKFSPLTLAAVKNYSPGAKVRTARERAIVFLRMLRGERKWGDGSERRLDDCFEMYDGDDVVRCVVAIGEAIPAVKHLLIYHRNLGEASYLRWKQFVEKEAQMNPELPLSV